MIFKNTFKLLLSNFSLCYKVLFYKLIVLLLALALAGTIGTPFLMHLGDTQFFSYIVNEFALMFENINLGNVFIAFKNIRQVNLLRKCWGPVFQFRSGCSMHNLRYNYQQLCNRFYYYLYCFLCFRRKNCILHSSCFCLT